MRFSTTFGYGRRLGCEPRGGGVSFIFTVGPLRSLASWIFPSQAGHDGDLIRTDERLAVCQPAGQLAGRRVGMQLDLRHRELRYQVEPAVTVHVAQRGAERSHSVES